MTDAFLFHAVDVDDRPVTDEARVLAARDAADRVTGLTCDGQVTRTGESIKFRCVGPDDLILTTTFALDDRQWFVNALDNYLAWADGRPNETTQALAVGLIRAILEIAPPYLGTAVWPFGPVDPEIYDTSEPFRLTQIGPVLFLSNRYLDTQLAGDRLTDAPVWRREDLPGGVLLLAHSDLLYSPDDPPLDELRSYLDRAHR